MTKAKDYFLLADAVISLPQGKKSGCGSQDIEIDVNVFKDEAFRVLKDFALENGFKVSPYEAWPNRITISVPYRREQIAELVITILEGLQLKKFIRLISSDYESNLYSPANIEVDSFVKEFVSDK